MWCVLNVVNTNIQYVVFILWISARCFRLIKKLQYLVFYLCSICSWKMTETHNLTRTTSSGTQHTKPTVGHLPMLGGQWPSFCKVSCTTGTNWSSINGFSVDSACWISGGPVCERDHSDHMRQEQKHWHCAVHNFWPACKAAVLGLLLLFPFCCVSALRQLWVWNH